jgi:hypothetical protein
MTPSSELVAAYAEHCGSEINANDEACAAAWSRRFNCEIGCAGAQVQHAFTTRERQCVDRAAAPPPIDTGTQKVVEEVVSAGNGVEHAGDSVGRL